MKIIKFRVWDEDRRRFYDSEQIGIGWLFNAVKEIGVEAEQFTGLLDKDGKEIYEGDIIKFTKYSEITTIGDPYSEAGIRVVKVLPETQQLGWYCSGYTFCKQNCETIVKIIGNIHENPELLPEETCLNQS